jgi:UDP-N-acetylmuramoyl-tripeptide--D-alanyl-D-alanine ligase
VDPIQSCAEVSCVRFSTAELASRIGGELSGPDVTVDGASIDSRTIASGQLFVPIVADRDGHDFIDAALEAGAGAYLTSRQPTAGTAIRVADTQAALTELGSLARQRIDGDVVGITGSVGKTTTKDMVGHCLASTYRAAQSARSLNNELGVPLTLLNAAGDEQWIVLEMGARGPGHIAELAELTRPRVGIVTSVAMAHVEFFGDLEGVFRAKGELITSLPSEGVAVLNADDERVVRMRQLAACPVLTYGISVPADIMAEDIQLDDDLRPTFRLATPWGSGVVTLRLFGEAQVANALAAATASLWCEVPLDAVVASLAEVRGSDMRMDVRRPPSGPALVIDCYNANPLSTEAALRSLARLGSGTKVALLGRMAELGAETEHQHVLLAELAQELGLRVVGYQTDLYGPDRVDTVAAAVELVQSLGSQDSILFKGSRVARLEEVVRAYGDAIGDPSLVP